MSFDLFWVPQPGNLVRAKPCAKRGIRPFDDHPLMVKRVHDVDGIRVFACQTTGPLQVRTLLNGRKMQSTPMWEGYYFDGELIPIEGGAA